MLLQPKQYLRMCSLGDEPAMLHNCLTIGGVVSEVTTLEHLSSCTPIPDVIPPVMLQGCQLSYSYIKHKQYTLFLLLLLTADERPKISEFPQQEWKYQYSSTGRLKVLHVWTSTF